MIVPEYNFIINCTDSELKQYKEKDLIKDTSVFSRFDLEWCLQAYLILAGRNNIKVSISNTINRDAINVIHSAQLLALKGTFKDFIVCVRADYPKRRWAHYHLVQNYNQLQQNTSFVPLWLQPGLIRRDASRTIVKKIAYAGQTFNGNLAGSVDAWKKLLEPHGFEFITLPSGACNDLHSVDVLIGIRSFDKRTHNTKPPSKLINAWHAHIPFIGGYDSAFKQVGIPGEDYLLAQTPEDVLNAVIKLRDNPSLYAKLVQNGVQKARRFTTDIIAGTWEEILLGPVFSRYKKWKSDPVFEKLRFKVLLGLGVLEHESKQIIKKVIFKN